MPGGSLRGGRWTRVLWGVGWYAVDYALRTGAPGGRYRTYPIYSSGSLPDQVTHQVRGYGDVWVWSPTDTTWSADPVGP